MKATDYPCAAKANQDMGACTVFFELYSARIFTYFQYRFADSATAQDLTMQVFENLLRSLPRYDETRAPFPAWLFSIARHVAADWQRRQSLRRFIPWDDIARQPSSDPAPEQVLVDSEERRRLSAALSRLSSRERDLIGLRFTGDMTNRAIAELTGLSENHVAVIIYRALNKLRQSLAETAVEAGFPESSNEPEPGDPRPEPVPQTEGDHE